MGLQELDKTVEISMDSSTVQIAESSSSRPPPPTITSPAHRFPLYGWKPDPSISEDENYLDVVMLITRSVQGDGQQGHMGALIVRPPNPSDQETDSLSKSIHDGAFDKSSARSMSPIDTRYEYDFYSKVIGAATNTPLFGGKDVTSDIHAEINALGQACRASRSTEGCTAYITIHPCKRCFAALVTFGIKRIVCRREIVPLICETAYERGIQVRHLTFEEQNRQMQRLTGLLNAHKSHEELMNLAEDIQQKRKERKLAMKQKKEAARAAANGAQT
jgi:deoxycytidylate deaminase